MCCIILYILPGTFQKSVGPVRSANLHIWWFFYRVFVHRPWAFSPSQVPTTGKIVPKKKKSFLVICIGLVNLENTHPILGFGNVTFSSPWLDQYITTFANCFACFKEPLMCPTAIHLLLENQWSVLDLIHGPTTGKIVPQKVKWRRDSYSTGIRYIKH